MDNYNLEKNYYAKCLEINDIVAMEQDENVPSTSAMPNFAPKNEIVQINALTMQPGPVTNLMPQVVQIQPGYQSLNMNGYYQGNYAGQQELLLQQCSNNVNNSFLIPQFNYVPTPLRNYNHNIQPVTSSPEYWQCRPIQAAPYAPNWKSNQRSCTKLGYDNHNQKNRKPSRNTNIVKEEEVCEPSIKKLGLTPNNGVIDMFTIVTEFRKLAYFIQLLCEERHSLESLLLNKSLSCSGYKPNTDYLPIIITDLSKHINLTKQAVLHEFIEFDKLFESISNNYTEFKELNLQLKSEFMKLEEFDKIRIRHKNGMLLLPNNKLIILFSSIKNIKNIIRQFSIYVKVLQFKIKETKNESIKNEPIKNGEAILEMISASKRNYGN